MLLLVAPLALAADPDAGALLAGLGGCASCHEADYGGGHAIETEHGTFYGTNLTPHALADWTLDDFNRAMRKGRGPAHGYWPAFPFPSFTRLTDADLADLWAFLGDLEPVDRANVPHETDRGGLARWAWRVFLFEPARFRPERFDDAELARGAYLVDVVGHCGECHNPRSSVGRLKRGQWLAGGTAPPYPAPNLTPHEDGLAGWSHADLESFFEMGMTPDGDFVGRGMRHVIRDGTALLPPEDRAAMARYLLSLEPLPRPETE